MKRPDWNKVMADCGGASPDANDLVQVTRETLRLALAPLKAQIADEAYHNHMAARDEITAVLDGTIE